MHEYVCTCVFTSHAPAFIPKHSFTQNNTYTYTHSHTHAHIHLTHTCTHALTHTYTHTQLFKQYEQLQVALEKAVAVHQPCIKREHIVGVLERQLVCVCVGVGEREGECVCICVCLC
jgi:hypothetical protein